MQVFIEVLDKKSTFFVKKEIGEEEIKKAVI